MKPRAVLLLLAFIFPASLVAPIYAEPSALEIVRTIDKSLRGESSQGRLEILIERPRMKRSIILDSWEERKSERSFMRIIEPKKDKGIAFLKWGENLWQYIPKIGKEIKIEGSLMQDSWMGSDFTNDDLVKVTSIVDDYTHKFLPPPGPDQLTVEMVPKPTAPVVWSRV